MMNHQLQRRQSYKRSVLLDPDEYEFAAAEILTELLDLIPANDFRKPSFRWGAKRRRSAIALYTQSKFATPAATPPSTAVTLGDVVAAKSKAASPATPLMFSISESDDKARTPSRASVTKRKLLNKGELTQSFTDLTHQKASLMKEMEAVKRHLDNLKASNMELKNRKQVIIYGLNQPLFPNLHNPHHHHLNHYHHQQQQQNQLQYPIQWPSFITPSPPTNIAANGSVSVLPDLNLSFEETGHVEAWQPSDAAMMEFNVNRAMASAQARKRRMQIYKEKNQNQSLRRR